MIGTEHRDADGSAAGGRGRVFDAPAGVSKTQPRPRAVAGWTSLARKFRLNRGPLRWWLIIAGLLTATFDPVRFILGTILVVAGTALHFVSKACLRQERALTVSGPYRFTRNPFYLANLLIDSGLLLIIGNLWVAAIYGIVWVWVYRKTILAEEASLSRLFGENYGRYCRRVPRLLPLPWRYLPRAEITGPQFSLRNPNIFGGREIERTLRYLSYPPLLYVAAVIGTQGAAAVLQPSSWVILAAAGFLALNLLGWLTTRLLRPARVAWLRQEMVRSVGNGALFVVRCPLSVVRRGRSPGARG